MRARVEIASREIFRATKFMRELAVFVREHPEHAPRAYANAARRFRREATRSKSPRDCHALADRLDVLATAPTPQTTAHILKSRDDRLIESVETSKRLGGSELSAAWIQSELMYADGEIIAPQSAVPARMLFGTQAYIQYGGSPSNETSYATGGALTGAATFQQEAPLCRWDGTEEETQALTVVISPGQNVSPGTYPAAKNGQGQFYNYRPFAHVFFGTALGHPNEVVVDVGRGIQFTIICCFVNVNVGMDPPIQGSVPGSMVVTGSIGFNPAGTNAPITRTRYIDNLPNVGGQNTRSIIVPAFATQLLPILRSDVSGGSTITLNFRDAAGLLLSSFALSGSTQQQQPLPITGDVFSIDVVNTGGQTASVHLCFALSL